MRAIHAIYQDGVFRPLEPVELPEGCKVTVEPIQIHESEPLSVHQKRIYTLLSESNDTGDPDLSSRHDEHQP
jgi:predicted DNA-binding antitoxin AbrB/MazE fold protein